VDAVSLGRFPKCTSAETNPLSMCERIKKLEQQKITEEALSENVSRSIQIEYEVNNCAFCSAIVRSDLASGEQASSSVQNEVRGVAFFFMELPCQSKILLFNIYVDHNNLDMYLDVLSKTSPLRMKYVDISHSIIGGDFNTDLSPRSSLHTIALLEYLSREGLI